MTISYTTEIERGCGYRKEGGLYVCAGAPSVSSKALPLPLAICPTCHSGVKQSRSWTWIEPAPLFLEHDHWDESAGPLSWPGPYTKDVAMGSHAIRVKAGLLWIGETFYKTPKEFLDEGAAQGISRRISALPNDFVVGLTRIFFAHPVAMPGWDDELGEFTDDGEEKGPGIFSSFVPHTIEYILKQDERYAYELTEHCETLQEIEDEYGTKIAETIDQLSRKEARGITLVAPTRLDSHGQLVDDHGNQIGQPLIELAREEASA